MKKRIRRMIAVLIAAVMILQMTWVPGTMTAEAAETTTTVIYDVTYCQTEARSMLDMVNEFRTGSDAWYWNDDDTTKTTLTNLSELTYDYTLEEVAMQRAAEIAIYYSHTRPDGNTCWTAYNETSITTVWSVKAENIAAGTGSSFSKALAAFTAWQETDENYSGQGHRRNMLSSNINAIGIACVYYNGIYYWVQEFGKTTSLNTSDPGANDSTTTVSADVISSNVSSVTLTSSPASYTMTTGDTASVPTVTASFLLTGTWSPYGTKCSAIVSPTWTVGNSSLLSISDDGTTITALAAGSTTLTATVLGKTIEVPVTITPSISDCTITLSPTSYTYDGEAKEPEVMVEFDGTKLTENTDYTLTYSNNVNAGTATVTVTGTGNYTGSAEKTFTINKADYTAATYDQVVVANQATYDISVDISGSVLPGGTVGTPEVSGTGAALIDAGSLAVADSTVMFNVRSQQDGTTETITVPVTGCTNYNDYNITITVTAKAVALSVTGTITGYTGTAIDDTEITVAITGGSTAFAETLTGSDWITNLPSGLTQTVSRVNDTTVKITVSGTPTSAFTGSLEVTIPAGNLAQVSGDFSVTGGSIAIEKAAYELTLTDISGSFETLTYGYTAGSSVTYTFTNTGNQDITGLSIEATDGFTVSQRNGKSALTGITVAKGDSITVTVTSDTGLHAGTTSGTLTLDWTGAEAELTESLSQTVVKKDLMITADSTAVEYGDAAPTCTATYRGLVNGDDASALNGTLTFACTYAAGSGVGNYTITPSGVSSDDYEITFVDGTLTVGQRIAEINWSTLSESDLVYTGTAKTLTATVGNAVGDDDVSVTIELTGDNVNVTDAGFYYTAIALTGADSANYKLPANVTGATYVITPADVVITAADASKTCGDADPTLTGSVSGAISDADLRALDVSYSRETGEDAGTYVITPSYTANSNYTVSVVAGTFTVNKKAITVTADDKTSVYGEDLQSLTWTITTGSLADGDTADDLAITLTKAAGTDAGIYAISGSSAAANYEVTVIPGTYTITKASLTVTANDNTITYGDAPADAGAVYSGLTGGDTEAAPGGELTFTFDYSQYGDVGTYTITPSGLSSDNYEITYVAGTLTVEQKTIELVWTPEAEDLVYDGTAKEVNVSIGNKAKEDDDVSVTAVLTGDNVNVTEEGFCYTVTELSGTDSGNYKLPENVTASVTWTVAPAPLTVTANDYTITYGDAPVASGVTYVGFVNGETEEVLDGELIYSFSYQQGDEAGTYTITPSGLRSANYVITYVDGTLTVLAQPSGSEEEPESTTTEEEPESATTEEEPESATTEEEPESATTEEEPEATTAEEETAATTESDGTATDTDAENNTKADNGTGTNTGDSGNVAFWVFLMILSSFGIIVLGKGRKKAEENA